MNILEALEIYNLISRDSQNVESRKRLRLLRKIIFSSISLNTKFVKAAFDTRRIDQETEFNPRRGLQNYSRSEAFISESLSQRIKNFIKLRNVLNGIKQSYGKEHEWQDSNARVLLTAIDSGLRTGINDEGFVSNQPGLGSFDYLEELLNVRYRLGYDQLVSMSESDLKKTILSKDENLIYKDIKQSLKITKSDVARQSYDTLMDKLFDGCHASADNPDIERTITITVRDRFHKQGS